MRACHRQLMRRDVPLAVFTGEYDRRGLADNFFRRVTRDALGRTEPMGDAAVDRQEEDGGLLHLCQQHRQQVFNVGFIGFPGNVDMSAGQSSHARFLPKIDARWVAKSQGRQMRQQSTTVGVLAIALLLCSGESAFAKGGGRGGGGHHSSSAHSSSSHSSGNSHSIRGYTKKDGTVVAPSGAKNPNGSKADNYSTRGNSNPYSGKQGTKLVIAPRISMPRSNSTRAAPAISQVRSTADHAATTPNGPARTNGAGATTSCADQESGQRDALCPRTLLLPGNMAPQ